jgi:hypothetical protein
MSRVTLFVAAASAAAPLHAAEIVVLDDFSSGRGFVSAQAVDGAVARVSAESVAIAPLPGLDRRRWVEASHARWASGWTGAGTEPAHGSASVAIGAAGADFQIGIWGGNDMMFQSASASLSYRALPGGSFDLRGFEFLDILGSGAGGLFAADDRLYVTVAGVSGSMTYSSQGIWNGPIGAFRIPLWHGPGYILSDPNGGRIDGSVDLGAVTSVSIEFRGRQDFGPQLYGGCWLSYSMTGIQFVVPGPGAFALVMMAAVGRRGARRAG